MKTYARLVWTAVAVVIVAGLALVPIAAQGAAGRGQDRPAKVGPGFGRGLGPGAVLHRLNLTDAQRDQIRAIVQEQRQGEAPLQKAAALHRDLHAAIFADAPDHAAIEQLKASLADAQAAALAGRVDTQLRIAQVLTPEQRAQARELPAERRGPGRRR